MSDELEEGYKIDYQMLLYEFKGDIGIIRQLSKRSIHLSMELAWRMPSKWKIAIRLY